MDFTLEKSDKILLGIFLFSLIISLFNVGVLRLAIIIGIVFSIRFSRNLNKIEAGKSWKLLVISLSNFILFFGAFIFLSLTDNSKRAGWDGLGYLFGSIFIVLAFIVSFVVGTIIILLKKNEIRSKGLSKPKLVSLFVIISVLLLGIFFYTPLVKDIAYLSDSPSFCSFNIKISDKSFIFSDNDKNLCLYDIAIKNRDITICHKMEGITFSAHYYDSNSGIKSKCFYDLAKILGNDDICKEIGDIKDRASCISNVKRTL